MTLLGLLRGLYPGAIPVVEDSPPVLSYHDIPDAHVLMKNARGFIRDGHGCRDTMFQYPVV